MAPASASPAGSGDLLPLASLAPAPRIGLAADGAGLWDLLSRAAAAAGPADELYTASGPSCLLAWRTLGLLAPPADGPGPSDSTPPGTDTSSVGQLLVLRCMLLQMPGDDVPGSGPHVSIDTLRGWLPGGMAAQAGPTAGPRAADALLRTVLRLLLDLRIAQALPGPWEAGPPADPGVLLPEAIRLSGHFLHSMRLIWSNQSCPGFGAVSLSPPLARGSTAATCLRCGPEADTRLRLAGRSATLGDYCHAVSQHVALLAFVLNPASSHLAERLLTPFTRGVLLQAGLVRPSDGSADPAIITTPAGFRFVLLSPRAQILSLVTFFLDLVEAAGAGPGAVVECLRILFGLGFLGEEQTAPVTGLPAARCGTHLPTLLAPDPLAAIRASAPLALLHFLSDVGCVAPAPGPGLRATGLLRLLFQDHHHTRPIDVDARGQMAAECAALLEAAPGMPPLGCPSLGPGSSWPAASGFVIVESNFRVYAYTASSAHVALLSLFCTGIQRFADLFVGVISRGSILRAVEMGITSADIIKFLFNYSHSSTLGRTHRVPPTVLIQISLWAAEMERISTEDVVLITDFKSERELHQMLRRFPRPIFCDPARQLLVVSRPSYEAWMRSRQASR